MDYVDPEGVTAYSMSIEASHSDPDGVAASPSPYPMASQYGPNCGNGQRGVALLRRRP